MLTDGADHYSSVLWTGAHRRNRAESLAGVRSFIEAAAEAAHEEHRAVVAGRDVRFERGGISGYALFGERGVLHAAAFAG